MREIRRTARFKKDYNEAIKRGITKQEISEVVTFLAAGKPLPVRFKDHKLSGNFVGYRECHIRPDYLLVYKIDDEALILMLVRMGTHADLFGL